MKNILYILTFFIFGNATSQNSIEVIYGKKFIPLKENASNIKYKSRIANFKKNISQVEYCLNIHGKESLFQYNEQLNSDFNQISPRIILSGDLKKEFYTNLEKREKKYTSNLFDENYIVEVPFVQYSWELKNETKEILGFKCYKAISSITIDDFRGNQKISIQAWYAPQLPSGFGPSSYSGLPGLVLEVLYDDKIKIFAKNINKSNDKISLKSFRGKEVSEEQITDIFNKGMKKIENGG